MTEHADPDQIDAHFPPDVLAGDGSMVGYYEILPYAKPVEFTLGAQTWLLDDQHCVRANCSCQEAALSFFELRPSAQHSGIGSEPTLCIRYAYDTGQIEPLSGEQRKDSGPGRISSTRGQDFVFGGVDVLVNNAGIMTLSSIATTDDATFDRPVAVNLKGTSKGLREAAKRLRTGGRIINFSTSVIGLRLETYGIYAATKSPIETLTAILSKELRGRSITTQSRRARPGPTYS